MGGHLALAGQPARPYWPFGLQKENLAHPGRNLGLGRASDSAAAHPPSTRRDPSRRVDLKVQISHTFYKRRRTRTKETLAHFCSSRTKHRPPGPFSPGRLSSLCLVLFFFFILLGRLFLYTFSFIFLILAPNYKFSGAHAAHLVRRTSH